MHACEYDKAPVTPGLRSVYDLAVTETCWNRGQILERSRTHDLSRIASAQSDAAMSMVVLNHSHTGSYDFWIVRLVAI